MPEHLKPAHRPSPPPPHPLTQLSPTPHPPSDLSLPPTSSSTAVPTREGELSEVLHSQAHLQGQLESVMEECRQLLRERADLSSRLAATRAQLEVTTSQTKNTATLTTSTTDQHSEKMKEEIVSLQRELKQARMAVEAAKEETSRGRASRHQLEKQIKELKKQKELSLGPAMKLIVSSPAR